MALKLGVHPQTLRRWERPDKMPKPERTLGNQRRYRVVPSAEDALTVGSVRVSSPDQKEDLERQKAAVKSQAGKPVDLIISDLGSGLNDKKAGLSASALADPPRQGEGAGFNPQGPPAPLR